MDDIWMRILDNMSDRVSGPLKFRLLLQPLMAAIFAIKAGLLDARTGKPPYFWALATSPEHRVDMLKDGWKSVGKVFLLAVVLDVAQSQMSSAPIFSHEWRAVGLSVMYAPTKICLRAP